MMMMMIMMMRERERERARERERTKGSKREIKIIYISIFHISEKSEQTREYFRAKVSLVLPDYVPLRENR